MKKICFVNYDMTVTGGVEQLLPMSFVKNMKYIFMQFLEKEGMFHMTWIRESHTEQN